MRATDLPEHVSAWRLLLVIMAAAVPGFGWVRMLVDPGADPDWSRRCSVAALALFVLWRSFSGGWIRDNLRLACISLGVLLQVWFAHQAGLENMQTGHVLGLMLISGTSVTLLRSLPEMSAFSGIVLVSTVWAYHYTDDPAVPMSLTGAVIATALVGMAAVTLSRVRVESALIDAHKLLEARVIERTEALAAEVRERRAAEAEAQQANRAKSRFLANMSHELRTPLNAVLGYTELVQESLRDIEQVELVHDLDRVRDGARHLLRMIDDVLDMARIDADQLDLIASDVDILALMSHLTRLIEPERSRVGLGLEMIVEPGLAVCTDKTRLSQILLNLLTNAVKFTNAGKITIIAKSYNGNVLISVQDTGIGLSSESIGILFQPFVQIDDAPTRRHDGTGLGLALSRDLAHRLGGTLTVQSILGEGSTFTLCLPDRDLPSERRSFTGTPSDGADGMSMEGTAPARRMLPTV